MFLFLSIIFQKNIEIKRELDITKQPDLYIPADTKFNELAASLGIKILNLEKQVELTVNSVQRQINS